MKTLKIALAAAVLSTSSLAAAADLGTLQQRAEQGLSPVEPTLTISVDDSARPTSHDAGEAYQQAVTGSGYTPATSRTAVAHTPRGGTAQAPAFGIGEAQQVAESGQSYGGVASRRTQVDVASIK